MLGATDLTKRHEDDPLALDLLNLEGKEGQIFCLLNRGVRGEDQQEIRTKERRMVRAGGTLMMFFSLA